MAFLMETHLESLKMVERDEEYNKCNTRKMKKRKNKEKIVMMMELKNKMRK